MYTRDYRNRNEIRGMYVTLSRAVSQEPTPPQVLEAKETPGPLARLIIGSTTKDERVLLSFVAKLCDQPDSMARSGKALRGELRRLWLWHCGSRRRFYAAFYAVQGRWA